MEENKTIAVIIPNEEILDIPVYKEESYTLHHDDMIKHFTKKYNLGPIDEYDLVSSGHVFLRAVDNLIMCYIPRKLTEKQFELLLEERDFLKSFPIFCANIHGNNDLIIENAFGRYETKGRNIVDCFYEEIASVCLESRGLK